MLKSFSPDQNLARVMMRMMTSKKAMQESPQPISSGRMLIFLALLAIAGCQTHDSPEGLSGFPEHYPALHPRYRSWPSPAGGDVVGNPPVFCWPATRGPNIRYAIRIARDSLFRGKDVYGEEAIPWTLYHPHRALQAGVWYWQYRQEGRPWSPVMSFRIEAAAAAAAVPPPADSFLAAIPATHPRVLLDAARLPAFRQNSQGSQEAEAILRDAEAALRKPIPREPKMPLPGKAEGYRAFKLADADSKHLGFGALAVVETLCQAYLLDGNHAYAERALRWGQEIAAWDPEGFSGYSDFGDAGCMLAMALVYDTFYEQLDSVSNLRLRRAIQKRAGRCYAAWINDIDAKVLSNHVWQYLLHFFMQTALAVQGDVPEADAWLRYGYTLWLGRAPVLGGKEGGWLEGASYFTINMETLLDIPAMIKRYTGYDFIRQHPWYAANPYWMMYCFPAGSYSDGFGDNVENKSSPGPDYLAYADALSRLTGNRVAATYARQIAQREGRKLGKTKMLRWFRLQYLRELPRPAPLPDSALPKDIILRDIGVVSMHSDPAHPARDLMVTMRSSPYGAYGHMLADQNTFNILYGGKPVFYMSGHKIAMSDPHRLGWYKATIGHNGILIDGRGQTFDPEGWGWLPRFLSGERLSYVAGDASMAYGGRKNTGSGLRRFRRHLLLIRPNMVLVYDDLEADHAAQWSYWLHSPDHLTLDSASGRLLVPTARASAQAWLFSASPLGRSITDTFTVPAINWRGASDVVLSKQWHFRAQTEAAEKMRFLTLIRIDQGGDSTWAPIPSGQGRWTLGGWTVEAELNPSRPPLLKVSSKDGLTLFSSNGDDLRAGHHHFRGQAPGSAKLAEWREGRWVFTESADRLPEVVTSIPQPEPTTPTLNAKP